MNEYAFCNFVAKPALTIKSIDLYPLLSYIWTPIWISLYLALWQRGRSCEADNS